MDTHFEEMDTHDPAGAEMDTHDSSETTVGVHIVSGCPHCQCQWVSTLLVGVHVFGSPLFIQYPDYLLQSLVMRRSYLILIGRGRTGLQGIPLKTGGRK